MSARHPSHRAAARSAALLVVTLVCAPSALAEPRESWPGQDTRPGTGDRAGPGSAPDLLADLLPGNCNAARLGAIAGATIGGVIGSRIGEGDGGALATVAGTLIGALIGSGIGREMDNSDERCSSTLPPAEEGVISATGKHSA